MSPSPASVQAASSNLQGINTNPADNFAQSGFSGYDFFRPVELNTKDSGKSFVEAASNSGKSGEKAASDKAAQVSGDGTGQSTKAGSSGAGNGSSSASASASSVSQAWNGSSTASASASASAWSLAQQEAVSMPAGILDQGAQSVEGQPGASFEIDASSSVSAAIGTKTLAAIEQSVFGGQGVAVGAKRIDEPDADQVSSPGLEVLQASPSNLQAANMQPADSAQTMYDPSRAEELANSMLEQMGSGSGGVLVLDMAPEGLGKISLKVGARKDEISVEALTQNEPARQALMSHSVELRQDLRNQGLVLGKFMVDVNGGKAGGESSAQANQSGGQGRGAPKATKARTIKISKGPVQTAAVTGRSQINIFA